MKSKISFFTCITALLLYSAGAADMPGGWKVIYRYRCFTGTLPEWVSPIDSVGNISHTSSSNDIHTIGRGTGFDSFITTDFDGSSEYIRATNAISTIDDYGRDSYTIQAWFLADTVSGCRTLFSNMAGNTGFALKIKNGQLCSITNLANGSGYIQYEVLGGTIEAGKWYHAAARINENTYTQLYNVHLYLNGSQVAQADVPHYDGISQSTQQPMIAAEPEVGVPVGDYFDGLIYSVSVANYAMNPTYSLSNKTMRDGGRYFGVPSYHDYLDSTKGVEYRLLETCSKYPHLLSYVSERFYCPLLNDNYVPQGLATDGVDTLYISMYWMDSEGNTGSYPSVVVQAGTDGSLKRVLQLRTKAGAKFYGHVGGIAYWDGYIYVPYTGTSIMRYNVSGLSSAVFNPETFANPKHDANPINADATYTLSMSPNTGVSFMSTAVDYDGSPILWLGQYDSSAQMYIFGYRISADGAVSTTPLYTFLMPVTKVQGIYCHQSNSDNLRIYLSASCSDNPSYIYDVRYRKAVPTCQSYTTRFCGPAGLEGIARIGSDFWCISESGGKYYQKRSESPWTDFYPFVFRCRFNRLGDINLDGSVDWKDMCLLGEQWLAMPGSISADIDDTWGDGFVDVYDFIQLGRDWRKSVSSP